MERLTCIDSVGNISTSPKSNKKSVRYGTQECLEKLFHYEDLEEQGRLIELPCKVGDTVYVHTITGIKPNGKPLIEIFKCRVVQFHIDSFHTVAIFRGLDKKESVTSTLCIECFDKSVFLTKEEAEQALAEMESKHGL